MNASNTAILLWALFLSACAPRLEGDYVDPAGAVAFRLAHGKYLKTNPDGSLFRHQRKGHAALPLALPYKVDGQLVLVEGLADRAQFDILPDGRLKSSQGGQALIFVRK